LNIEFIRNALYDNYSTKVNMAILTYVHKFDSKRSGDWPV